MATLRTQLNLIYKRHPIEEIIAKIQELGITAIKEVESEFSKFSREFKKTRKEGKVRELAHKIRAAFEQFLDFVEGVFPRFTNFFIAWMNAEDAFQNRQWVQAINLFDETRRKLPSSLHTFDKTLRDKFNICENAYQMGFYINLGNEYYLKMDWAKAKGNFETAKRMHQKEFPIEKTEFDQAISVCNRGLVFNSSLKAAKKSAQKKDWEAAKQLFEQALSVHHMDFGIEKAVLQKQLKNCTQKLNKQKFKTRKPSFGKMISTSLFHMPKLTSPKVSMPKLSMSLPALPPANVKTQETQVKQLEQGKKVKRVKKAQKEPFDFSSLPPVTDIWGNAINEG